MEIRQSSGEQKLHTRQANFELLRIKAMMMVVMLHYFSKGGLLTGFGEAWHFGTYAAWLLEAFCASSVNAFVLLSGYFLVEAGFRWKRLVTLWLQVLFYSVGIAVVLLLTGVWQASDITLYALIDYIFPVQTEHYWFATAYIFLYLFSPVLNAGMKAMTRQQHKMTVLLLIAVFSLTKSVIPFNLNMDHYGYDTLWFLCLYMIAGYIRLYGIPFFQQDGKEDNDSAAVKKKLFWKSVLSYLAASFAMFAVFMAVGGFYKMTGKLADFVTKSYQYNHILNLAASVALFYAFYHYEVKGGLAKIVCAVSPYVFGVYLLHEHIGLRSLWPQWFAVHKYGQTVFFLPHMLATVCIIFAAGIAVDYVRSLLFRCGERIVCSWKTILYREKICCSWQTILYRVIFPLILLLYPLIQINQGVDITDTGYNLGGFFYRGQIGEQWLLLSTYLANAVGGLLCKLPMGDTMLGMNLYTSLIVSGAALLVYGIFYKKMPAWIVFLGEILAIGLAWCPTVILYNYLTYFLFLAVTLCLYQALVTEKRLWFIAAGAALGLNVFVRFPNIAEAALILAVWYYGFLTRKKFSQVCRETGLCLLGFLLAFGTMLAIITVQFGAGAYADMLSGLFSLGSESGGGHSIGNMLWMIIRSYGKALGWMAYLFVFALAGVLCFLMLETVCAQRKWYRAEMTTLCRILYLAGIGVLFRLLYARGMFGIDYYVDGAIFQWTAVFLIITIAFAVKVLLAAGNEPDVNERGKARQKLYAALVLLVIVITPLGSDNHIYTNINNLFFAAPFTLYEIFRWIQDGRRLMAQSENADDKAVRLQNAAAYPIKALLTACVLMLLVQSVGFGICYVFRDGSAASPRDTRITQNPTLRGMYTSRDNAGTIEEITRFCEDNGLTGEEVILAGGSAMAEGIPGLSYYLKMPSAISNTWMELESYPYETMEREVELILEDAGQKPVVLVSTRVAAWLSEDLEAMNRFGVDTARYDGDRKLQLIRRLIGEKDYRETFVNHAYVIYQ